MNNFLFLFVDWVERPWKLQELLRQRIPQAWELRHPMEQEMQEAEPNGKR